jgi:hypothetical protein
VLQLRTRVIAVHQHAIDIEEHGAAHLRRAGIAPRPASTWGGMPSS